MTPWVANGALSLEGQRHRSGRLGARGLLVAETARALKLTLPADGGLVLDARVRTPRCQSPAGVMRPRRSEHDVANCSIAALELTLRRPGQPFAHVTHPHGAVYGLGMREHDHGVPIAPFTDG